jgi:hypothetical protein
MICKKIKQLFCRHKEYELIMYRKKENKPREMRCIKCGYTTKKLNIKKLNLRKNG